MSAMSDVRYVRCPTYISYVRIENFDVRRVKQSPGFPLPLDFVSPWVSPSLGTQLRTLFGFIQISLFGTAVFGPSLLSPFLLGPYQPLFGPSFMETSLRPPLESLFRTSSWTFVFLPWDHPHGYNYDRGECEKSACTLEYRTSEISKTVSARSRPPLEKLLKK